ncbi:YceI family protein [Segetibacter koreensis]|uniref:YceI family protein n=1 Tax=Segetibacter koreensis TaxID=398037 RepID=UPI00035F6905|nr:YceI family protein [Segetibacter koreensis]
MKKVFLSSFAIAVVAISTSAFTPAKHTSETTAEKKEKAARDVPAKWTADKAHSSVKFTVTHLVVSEVEGRFKMFDGSMETSKPDFSDAKINFTVDVNSVDTDNEMRDKDLKGENFFAADKYPQMKFVGSSFTPAGGNKYKLAGNLTIKDVTKPVVFDVTYGGTANAMGKTKMGFKAKTTIDRFDYNLKWNKATEAGGLVVSKDVDLVVNVELNKE